jgi:serine protease Do
VGQFGFRTCSRFAMPDLHRHASVSRTILLFATAAGVMFPTAAWAQSDFLSNLNESLEKIVTKVKPSVVRIDVITRNEQIDTGGSSGQIELSPTGIQQLVGSGVILSPDGYIMTDAHVVRGATSIKVTLDNVPRNGAARNITNVLHARVIGEFNDADLALLKVDGVELTPIVLDTDAARLREGQLVFSLGSPEGLSNTVSLGVISSLARQLNPNGAMSYIQTDAALNPGSSGGALVDIGGRLIGINAMFVTEGGGSERLGFAIPSRFVKFAYENIRDHGKVLWGEPGLKVQGITPLLAQGLHLGQNSGVVVSDVTPGSPASEAGLKILDVIADMDSKPVGSVPEFFEALFHKTPGQELGISVLRRSSRINFALKLLPAGEHSDAGSSPATSTINLVSKLGVFCSALSSHSQVAVQKLRSHRGVLVEARNSGDRPALLGPGDIIRSVNLEPVSTVGDLEGILDHITAARPIILQIERDAQFLFVTIEQYGKQDKGVQ